MNLPPLINVNSHKFVAIIPAAGTSERLASGSGSCSARNSPARFGAGASASQAKSLATRCFNEPKQYQVVCDKPLIFHTVSAFLR